jgi:hypothetical protein
VRPHPATRSSPANQPDADFTDIISRPTSYFNTSANSRMNSTRAINRVERFLAFMIRPFSTPLKNNCLLPLL